MVATHGSAEFALAAACCRWPPTPARDGLVRAAAMGVDWYLLARIAARHRVEGLVWNALGRAEVAVAGPAAETLAAAARSIAASNLRSAAESSRLRCGLEAAAVPPLFIKGLTLGELAYGTPALKMSWDIDVLIAREQLGAAVAWLRADGYQLTVPRAPGADLETWHDRSKETVWHHPARATWVELHTRLVDNALLLPGVGVGARPREVEVAKDIVLPTLQPDALFAYLCVHGASSNWFRLKWIADVAALLAAGDADATERLYHRALELGAGRAADQALLLARALFETPLTPALARRVESDRTSRWLFRSALRQMSGRSVAVEPTARRFGTLAIHLVQFGLLPGLGYKLTEGRRQLDAIRRGYG